jgi:hypothetical protein
VRFWICAGLWRGLEGGESQGRHLPKHTDDLSDVRWSEQFPTRLFRVFACADYGLHDWLDGHLLPEVPYLHHGGMARKQAQILYPSQVPSLRGSVYLAWYVY